MRCDICGQDYGVAHNCAGISPMMTSGEAAPPPVGFAPLYYLRLAFRIARWDDVSIRRAARDPIAGYYGALFWGISATVILLFSALPMMLRVTRLSGPVMVIALVLGMTFGFVALGCITFIQLGLCHLIAKWFFEGKGTFVTVMRPLLLGWFVNVLIVIPVVGLLAGAVAWTAVLMLVFEEVEGIDRLKAFLISAGINVCLLAVRFAILPGR